MPEESAAAYAHCKKLAGVNGAGGVMDEYGLDVLVAPSNSLVVNLATHAGTSLLSKRPHNGTDDWTRISHSDCAAWTHGEQRSALWIFCSCESE